MKALGTIALVAGAASVIAGCGVIYKPEVIISGCIAASRTTGEPVRGAKVDSHVWGPGQAEIDFVTQDDEEERHIIVQCRIDGSGELGALKLGDEKLADERLEAARKAFRDIAQSPAWENR